MLRCMDNNTTSAVPDMQTEQATLPQPGEVVAVTPEIATEWLGYNTHNRPPRKSAVAAYASDMANGDWLWTGDPIRRADGGTILDGQHRLLAVVESGVTVPFLVLTGLPVEAQENIDAGVPRKFYDVLALRGETSSSALAAIVRKVHIWESGSRVFSSGGGATHSQLSRTLEAHPGLRDTTRAAINANAKFPAIPTSLMGLAWWVFASIDQEDADYFFARLCDGQNLGVGNPIYELRKQLMQNKENTRGERNQRYLMALVIKAWNAYRDGTEVGQLRFRAGGANPESFPEPK